MSGAVGAKIRNSCRCFGCCDCDCGCGGGCGIERDCDGDGFQGSRGTERIVNGGALGQSMYFLESHSSPPHLFLVKALKVLYLLQVDLYLGGTNSII